MSVQIPQIIKKLRNYEHLVEEKFIGYGNLLNENSGRIKKTLSLVKETISIISSPLISKSIENLEGLIKMLKGVALENASDTRRTQELLKKISTELNAIVDKLGDFSSFVKRLRMLGLSTKIESSRITEIDNGFDNLADNVEKLSDKVEDKTKLIYKKSNKLSNLITNVADTTKNFNSRNNEITDSILEKINDSVSLLSSKLNLAKEKSEILSEYSDQVFQILGDIVASLQYQDISKQQIDHVCEALEFLLQEDNEEAINQNEGGVESKRIFEICSIQSAQLKNTKEEFLDATGSLNNDLKNVGNMTENLSQMTVEIMQSNDNDSYSFLSNASDELQTIIEIVTQNSQSESDLIKMIELVNNTVNDLSKFVNDVEDIGAEIELIAMNSQIKAARLGNEGASLGIIAENIKKLSVNTKDHTDNLSANFKFVDSEAEELNKMLMAGTEKTKCLTDQSFKQSVKEIFGKINEIQETSSTNFNEINNSLKQVRYSLVQGDDLGDFYKSSENIFDEAIYEIDRILEGFDPNFSADDTDTKYGSVLKDKYSMQSERIAHEKIMKRGKSGREIQEPGEINQNSDSSEFGGNVELF